MLLVSIPLSVSGHGMVLEPVNRASRWKFNDSAPINFDDNGLFCGGYQVILILLYTYVVPRRIFSNQFNL